VEGDREDQVGVRGRILAPLIRLALALAVGVSFPYVGVAWTCRAGNPNPDACAWTRNLLPVGRWIAPLVITPVAFFLFTLLAMAWHGGRGRQPQ
jgi:hypothetical protein